MSENNRNSIEKCRKKLPQFTTMNVIDGQAGLVIYSSLIFYSLTIDNILNIIVLLILAGVTIAMLTGENGILNQANESKTKTEIAEAKERAQVDILGWQTKETAEGRYGDINDSVIKSILTGKEYVKEAKSNSFISKKGNHEILYSELYESTGYYADIEGDGKVDGIIYADLAKGNTKSGQWGDSNGIYNIPVETGLKEYEISQKGALGAFGIKDVIKPKSGTTGKERFYVMALENLGGNTTYTWYHTAPENMIDYATATSGDFGKGKDNTKTMIKKWDDGEYGEKDKNPTCKDVWGQITEEVEKGWFVPSRAEWAAFAEELGITATNYEDFGLSKWYWSSSQRSETYVYTVHFGPQTIGNGVAPNQNAFSVRLSTIF